MKRLELVICHYFHTCCSHKTLICRHRDELNDLNGNLGLKSVLDVMSWICVFWIFLAVILMARYQIQMETAFSRQIVNHCES